MTSDTLTLEIERLVAGGRGFARSEDGRAIFVTDTAPGDRVIARVTKSRKDYAEAELIELLSPGPERREPPCPVANQCGGCQLQHLSYPAQLEAKRGILLENLRRLGRIETEPEVVVHASEEWEYRLRAELKVGWLEGKPIIGYYERRTHDVVAIPGCLILRPSFARAFKPLTKLVNERFYLFRGFSGVSFLDADDGAILMLRFNRPPKRTGPLFEALRWLCVEGGLAGASVDSPQGRSLNWGRTSLTLKLDEIAFELEPGAFVQTHRDLGLALWRRVRELGSQRPEQRALDLYGGAGYFATALAPSVRELVTVEANPNGARLAKQNLKLNRLSNVRSIKSAVDRYLSGDSRVSESFVVVDPPRQGLEPEVRDQLIQAQPPAILYVSCDPATLARDLGALCRAGYELSSLELFDLFPHTAHFESLALLERAKPS